MDPVTFLDCLHTNCGSCSKSWFVSQSSNRNPSPTCPVCREVVRETRPNAVFTTLLEDYLSNHPDKKRSPEDVRAAREIYKPGSKLVSGGAVALPPPTPAQPAAARRNQRSSPFSFPPSPPPLPSPSRLRGGAPRLSGAPRPGVLLEGLVNLPPGELGPQFVLLSLGAPPRREPPRPLPSNPSPLAPSPPSPPSASASTFVRRTPGTPATVADILIRNGSRVDISCDLCATSLTELLHWECTVCELFHLCYACFYGGKTCPEAHLLVPQRQVLPLQATPYVETGLFCNVCEAWIDEARDDRSTGAPNSFFWHCGGGCNQGNWNYCLECVRRGRCCDHQLLLYTNHRVGETGVMRGSGAAATQGPLDDHHRRWNFYVAYCDLCHLSVQNADTIAWYHCPDCPNGEYDLCTGCCALLESDGKCGGGHQMSLLELGTQGGAVRVLWRPEAPVPDICVGDDCGGGGSRGGGVLGRWGGGGGGGGGRREGDVGRNAVALSGNWSDERTVLSFPIGAGLREVRKAFEGTGERGQTVEWWWGVYCGSHGIFERSLVRLV